MEFNTIPLTNIDSEGFSGKYDGEDYPIKVGEVRYFPSEISKHFAYHLADKIITNAVGPPSKVNKDEQKEKLIGQILGEEMPTFTIKEVLTTKEKVMGHEAAVKKMLEEDEREKKAQKIEAMKIIEE